MRLPRSQAAGWPLFADLHGMQYPAPWNMLGKSALRQLDWIFSQTCSVWFPLHSQPAMDGSASSCNFSNRLHTVLAIPIHLLWQVQIKMRQKLGLAAFLCLSIFMIFIAIIRISGFIYHNAFDEGWVYLWQQIEACVSVSTISLTAFRSMFVVNASRRDREISPWQKSPASSWRRRYKKSATSSQGRELDDVSIPGATLTGMRTMVGEPRTQHDTLMSIPGEEDWPLRPPAVAARTTSGRLNHNDFHDRGISSTGRRRYENIDELHAEQGWTR